MNLKAQRMKTDLKRGLSQVFLKKGFVYVSLTDVILSSDYRYARIEVDVLKGELNNIIESFNENPLHKEIVKELHACVHINNFPKIKFFADSHKERIKNIDELFDKIKI